MFHLSKKSEEKLNTCKKEIQFVIREAIIRSPIDFGVAEGRRTDVKQKEYFDSGKSKCDGIIKKSNHQVENLEDLAAAVDLYAYINGKASWDKIHLSILAGVILSLAGLYEIEIRWGGTFGSNEFKGWDMPHFELIN